MHKAQQGFFWRPHQAVRYTPRAAHMHFLLRGAASHPGPMPIHKLTTYAIAAAKKSFMGFKVLQTEAIFFMKVLSATSLSEKE